MTLKRIEVGNTAKMVDMQEKNWEKFKRYYISRGSTIKKEINRLIKEDLIEKGVIRR